MQTLEQSKIVPDSEELEPTAQPKEFPVPPGYTGIKINVIEDPESNIVVLVVGGQMVTLSIQGARDLAGELRSCALSLERSEKERGVYKKHVRRLKNPKRGRTHGT